MVLASWQIRLKTVAIHALLMRSKKFQLTFIPSNRDIALRGLRALRDLNDCKFLLPVRLAREIYQVIKKNRKKDLTKSKTTNVS